MSHDAEVTGFLNQDITRGEFNLLHVMINAAHFETPAFFTAQADLLRSGLSLKMALRALTELGQDAGERFSKDSCVSKLQAVTKARKTVLDIVQKVDALDAVLPTEQLPGLEPKEAGPLDIQVCDMRDVFKAQIEDEVYSDLVRYSAAQKLSKVRDGLDQLSSSTQNYDVESTSWKKDLSDTSTIEEAMDKASATILELKGVQVKQVWEKLAKAGI